MFRKRKREKKEDPKRKLVHGILSLVLGTLATWLAGKLTDLILGPEEPEEPEEEQAE